MKITVTYGVKRSASFQTVNVELSAEDELQEGETRADGFKRVMAEIAPLVEAEAQAALRDAVNAPKP